MVRANEDLRAALLQPRAGWLLLAVSVLAGVEAFGLLRRGLLLLWPGLLLAGGVWAAVEVTLEVRRRGWTPRQAMQEAALRPRVGLAALALLGGLGEVLRAAGALVGPASFAWPLSLVALGGLLLLAGAGARGQAGQIGGLLLLAGLLRGFEAVFGVQPGAVGTGWFVVLFVAALLWLRAGRLPETGEGK